jgi:hypothetical protein
MDNRASGQHGIRFREALHDGDAELACSLLASLDRPHEVELVLGAALRDGRDCFFAARNWLRASDPEQRIALVASLARPGADGQLDALAAAYVAERRVSDRWLPDGRPLSPSERLALSVSGPLDARVANLYGQGVGGLQLLDALSGRPLYSAVEAYYRQGTIHALGPRPLLILAAFEG